MRKITYLKGDATSPNQVGNKIIAHICNDIGGWGKGFVMAISKKWKTPEKSYRQWFSEKQNFDLGEIQLIQVEADVFVANMIAQHGINTSEKPIRYDAVEKCLAKLASEANVLNASVHMPRIGCGLAGGKWEFIEPLIVKTLLANNIDVFIYDFE